MCSCHAKFLLDEDILQNACQRAQESSKQRSQQESNAQILAQVEKLHIALNLLQNQHSKIFQLLQNGQQSWKLDIVPSFCPRLLLGG